MCLLYHFLFKSLIVEVDYKRCVTTTDLLMLYCNQKKQLNVNFIIQVEMFALQDWN